MRTRPTDGVAFAVAEQGGGGAAWLVSSANPSNIVDVNDTNRSGDKFVRLDFGSDGTGYIVWRTFRDGVGFRAYMRKLLPNGTLVSINLDEKARQAGATAGIDQPAVAVNPANGKVYVTAQVQTNPPKWGLFESSNGGNSFTYQEIATNRPESWGIYPRICVGKDDNVHVIGRWGDAMHVSSRINGVWKGLVRLGNSEERNRTGTDVACANDGSAYAVYDTKNASFGMVRTNPALNGTWEFLGGDKYPGSASDAVRLTTTPDNGVWVVAGTRAGSTVGTVVLESKDRGSSWATVKNAIPAQGNVVNVDIAYGAVTQRMYAVVTYNSPASSYFSVANIASTTK